jgi:hypothetical protein
MPLIGPKKKKEPDEEPEKEEPPVEDGLRSFLRERFLELGFSPDDALWLSGKRADWHDAEKLIQGGCPPNVAARILAPID